jgi:hypothetical protein
MTSMKMPATVLGITVALALIGVQSSVAQPGSGFENRGERQSEGFPGYRAYPSRQYQRNPTSGQLARHQTLEACEGRAQSQVPGVCDTCVQQRYLIYSSCMYSYGQRP